VKRAQWIVAGVALALMAGGAGALVRMKAGHRLGAPGVKTQPIPDSVRLEVLLPERVADFDSQPVETTAEVLNTLPPDTSFGQRRYQAPDGFETLLNVVLMGTDRTSLHQPQFCLTGGGWHIDREEVTQVRINGRPPYDLPAMKLTTSREATVNGQTVPLRGLYVYWFVCDGAYTARHGERMWWMARELLRSGMLQRWAYVTCFSVCAPGGEEATYRRMEQFLSAAVPEFQLTPPAASP